jgi:hypothetical protein
MTCHLPGGQPGSVGVHHHMLPDSFEPRGCVDTAVAELVADVVTAVSRRAAAPRSGYGRRENANPPDHVMPDHQAGREA